MKFWEWHGRLYGSADPGRGKTFALDTHGLESPEGWTWSVLDPFTAREVWFGYCGDVKARRAAEAIEDAFA